MDAGGSSNLVSLNPAHVLTFKLERSSQPRAILRIANSSSQKVVFKVKTTQPSWYFVRPNQHILDTDQSEDVVVLMVENECSRLLDAAAAGEARGDEEKQHRFLVQSMTVSDSDFSRIRGLNPSQKIDEISKLWDSSRDDKRNTKLRVEFVYPEHNPSPTRAAGVSNRVPTSVAENVETVRNRLNRSDGEASSGGANNNNSSNSNNNSSPELILSELQTLRKKYDAVVEYTVHLTAERDSIVNQLEVSQRELNREKTRKKGEVQTAVKDKTEKKPPSQGFSLFAVLATALLCFILGKYLA